MASRFFIPRPKSTVARDALGIGLQLEQLRQQGARATAERERQADALKFKGRTLTETIKANRASEETAKGRLQVARAGQSLERQKLPPSQQAFQPSDVDAFVAKQIVPLSLQSGVSGEVATKVWDKNIQFLRALAEPKQNPDGSVRKRTKGQVYDFVKIEANKNYIYDTLIEGYEKEIKSKSTGSPIGEPQEVKAMQRRVGLLKNDRAEGRAINAMFPGVMRERAIEQQRIKGQGATIKSWLTPEGEVVNIPNNQAPPPGSTPLKSGLDVEVGPDGSVSLRTGVTRGGVGGASKTTQAFLEKEKFNTTLQLDRVGAIDEGYQKAFLELGPRLGASLTGVQEKLKGTWAGNFLNAAFGKVTPERRKFLREYTTWVTTAVDNANRYIKYITGAQMSEKEADRIMEGVVDANGLIIFDSDTRFRGKMTAIKKSLKLTLARTNYYLANGFSNEEIGAMSKGKGLRGHRIELKDMEGIINAEGDALEKDGFTPDQVKAELSKKYPSIFQGI